MERESIHQRNDIEMELQRESKNLSVLQESLQRSQQMTENMLGILTSFEGRLSRLEDAINPVYQETGNLQRRHENIEKTLAALDHVIGYYHVAEEVEPFIRDGPSSDLLKYMDSMEKLQTAVRYFNHNNIDSAEMSQVTTLYEAGKDALEREFRNLVSRHSIPVPPVAIMDAMPSEADEDMPAEELPTIEHFPEKVHNDLKLIAQWLLNCGINTDYMQVYASHRSSVVVRSLQSLKDHLKAGSRDSATMVVPHSPALRERRGTPGKKGQKKTGIKKVGTAMMKQTLAHLEAATGLKRQGSSNSDLKEEGEDMEIDLYLNEVSALLKLIQSEVMVMQGIIPDKHQRKVFDMLVQASLDLVMKEGDRLASCAKRAIAKHDYNSVLAVFPVLRHLRFVKPDFDISLEGCQPPTRAKLASLISTLDSTGAKALEEFVEGIRNDPDKSSYMPKDGTVHELTSNAMIFMEQLLEYQDTAGAMLLTSDPTALPDVANANKPKLKLAEYFTKVLSALGLNLTNKSDTYSDLYLRAIFLLNNYNYILKTLRRDGNHMLDVVHCWNEDVRAHFEDAIVEFKRQYSESWSRVVHCVTDINRSPGHKGSTHEKLKEKDRQIIKDKFTGFNKEVEDLHRIQKGYAIPDRELKESLLQENKDYILPKYNEFLNKYKGTNFTKNPEKYVKYNVEQVETMMSQFFDSAA